MSKSPSVWASYREGNYTLHFKNVGIVWNAELETLLEVQLTREQALEVVRDIHVLEKARK